MFASCLQIHVYTYFDDIMYYFEAKNLLFFIFGYGRGRNRNFQQEVIQ